VCRKAFKMTISVPWTKKINTAVLRREVNKIISEYTPVFEPLQLHYDSKIFFSALSWECHKSLTSIKESTLFTKWNQKCVILVHARHAYIFQFSRGFVINFFSLPNDLKQSAFKFFFCLFVPAIKKEQRHQKK